MDIVESAFDPDTADPGTIVWHTSDGEGGPPDVAYQVILAKGESLWIGEITRDRYEDAGGDKMGLGGDGGWWIIHYKGKDAAVLGKVADGSAADDLAALIASQARRIEELEKRLRPFGDVGDLLESETEGFTDCDEIRLVVGDLDVELERLRFEHFRRARATLKGETP